MNSFIIIYFQVQEKLIGKLSGSLKAQEAVKEAFDDETLKPFVGLETAFKQQKFYRDHFNLQVCMYVHVCTSV